MKTNLLSRVRLGGAVR